MIFSVKDMLYFRFRTIQQGRQLKAQTLIDTKSETRIYSHIEERMRIMTTLGLHGSRGIFSEYFCIVGFS